MLQALRQRFTLEADDARALVVRTFEAHPSPNFGVRLWDGQEVKFTDRPEFVIGFKDAEAFRRCFVTRDPAEFAEAYVEGRLSIDGDLWAAAALCGYLRELQVGLSDKLRLVPKLVGSASPHTPERDRRDVQTHYDLSDDFFRLFLDEKMIYSCAYFANPEQSLEQAQERKLELVCKKLALRPGETFLDVGCGWGALVIWAAQRYGVRARGITLSENQAAESRQRVAAAGLSDRVTIELRHYAELPENAFDKIGSVGMCEHVGLAKLPTYLRTLHRALRPGGLLLNHGITEPPNNQGGTGGAFIFRHVFPGAELAPVSKLQAEMEALGFEIEDVQALRRHYALTLREWFRRFRERRDQAATLVPERVLRIWDLYLAGCARAFEDGVIGVHQVLAAKPDARGRTQAHLTREEMALSRGGSIGQP
jgi:cyclopropane-fatty-acyl-phospholipid synthase